MKATVIALLIALATPALCSAQVSPQPTLPPPPSVDDIKRVCTGPFHPDDFIVTYCVQTLSERIYIEDADGNLPAGYLPPLTFDEHCADHIKECADESVINSSILMLNDQVFAHRRAVEFAIGKSPDEARVALSRGVPCNVTTYDVGRQHWRTWEYGLEGSTCIGTAKYTFLNGILHDVFNGGAP